MARATKQLLVIICCIVLLVLAISVLLFPLFSNFSAELIPVAYAASVPFGLDGKANGTWSSGTTITLGTLSTSYSNDVIIVSTGTYSTSSFCNVSSISDNLTTQLNYILRKQEAYKHTIITPYYIDEEEWYATWSSHGHIAIKVTLKSSTLLEGASVAFGVSFANTSSPFDSNSGLPAVNGSSAANPLVKVSTSNANDFIDGLVYSSSSGHASAGTGFTAICVGAYYGTQNDTVSSIQNSLKDSVTITTGNFAMIGDAVKESNAYKLSLKIEDCDLDNAISNAKVTMNNGSNYRTLSSSGGWANYTGVSTTSVTVNATYFGYTVNSTFTITMSATVTMNVKCTIYDLTARCVDSVRGDPLDGVKVVIYNSTYSTIVSGVTGAAGSVQLTKVPGASLNFTEYGGSSYSIKIGTSTVTISSDDSTQTLTCNRNYVSITDNVKLLSINKSH